MGGVGSGVPGNKFWMARSSHGKAPKFKDAEALWNACVEYFEWAEANPLHEYKPFPYQGEVTLAKVPKMRAMTLGGLCNFLDIDRQTFQNYCEREGYEHVGARVKEIIYQQKFEGAAAEMLNPSIIARDLGLADRREHSGPEGGPIQTEEVSARERIAGKLSRLAARSSAPGDTGKPE